MSPYRLTLEAAADMDEILEALLQEHPGVVITVLDDLEVAFQQLVDFPHSGHIRTDITSLPVRFWTVHSYAVNYDSEISPLTIIRVLHWRRDIEEVLGNEV